MPRAHSLGLCLLAAAVLGVAVGWSLHAKRDASSVDDGLLKARWMEDVMFGRTAIGGPFALTDTQGKRRSLDQFRGRIVLLYFGYNLDNCGKRNEDPCASMLLPHEAALLDGIVASPSAYDPMQHPVAARKRRDLVLQRMFEQGYLTRQLYEDAKAQDWKGGQLFVALREIVRGAGPELRCPFLSGDN